MTRCKVYITLHYSIKSNLTKEGLGLEGETKMNDTIKDAIYQIAIVVPALIICCLTMYGIAYFGPIENPLVFWGGIWLGCSFSGLWWILPIVTSGKNPQKGYDERDLLIFKRSVLVTYSVVWIYLVTACISICWQNGPTGDISASLFLGIIFVGLILSVLVHSLTIFAQYCWRR